MANLLSTRLIVSGGLIVLLFFLVSYKNLAILSYEGGEYLVEKERFFTLDPRILKDRNLKQAIPMNSDWDIEEVIYGDFNNSGEEDIGIYLWKVGNYGDSLPFWETENDDSYKQHLFIYSNDRDEYPAIWHSSNLPYHNVITFLTDINGDIENELVVLEKPSGKVAVWKWDNWGFKNLWRSENGNFDDLRLK